MKEAYLTLKHEQRTKPLSARANCERLSIDSNARKRLIVRFDEVQLNHKSSPKKVDTLAFRGFSSVRKRREHISISENSVPRAKRAATRTDTVR